ncbi:MAG: beta-ketoacyl synthase N-terminal-like domain-containing protein, partial [Acidobacteriota bacterium]
MNHRSSLAIENWLLERLAEQIGTAPEGIDPGARFSDLGLDSAASAALLADFATTTGRVCAPTLVWDHPTPAALARHLAGEGVSTRERPAERAHAAPAAAALADDAIAIIGMACRLPGADDPESFWRLLLAGRETVAEVPIGRRDAVAESSRPARGGFLEQVDRFDAAFFAISPREARQIDPQQRLMLELAWEAMEDAGLVVDRLRGSATGVFLGAMWSDYSRLPQMTLGAMTQHTAVGQDSSAIPGRIAYTFGFEGPSLAVNTACSSSLVAVHLACQSLRSGESTLALAGGVNLILAPESTVAMAEFGGLSPEGRCKAFAAAADGYVRGEGGGVVVLKPLTQARLDGDPIHAVVHGSWVNNDGYSNGLTAPNPQAQEALLRRAYERAGVDPTAVQYVEAHGTGTHLGDPIEAQALGETLGTGRAADQPLRIGSVKSNIGHLEAAAGVAGLLKTLLAIRHRRLPASLHCDEPNPAIPFDALGLEVQRQVGAWPRPQSVPVAGVSSFGFTGTNCHVVVGADAAPRSLFDRAESLAPGDAVRPVFVFSGTGAQWPGMALQLLLHEPLFRTAVQRCDRSLRRFVRWSLVAVLAGRPGARPLLDTEVTQFAIFAVQLGLCAVWRQWGVVPRAVVGHSVGEIAAAHVAGVLDLDEAIEILYHRSRLQERLAGEGGMALVELDAETLGPTLSDEVDIGCLNSPGSTVLSGPNEALAAEVERLRARGVRVHPVQIGFAAHSKATEPLAEELAVQLRRLQPRPGRISFVSTVTGKPVAGEALDAAYWASNVRQPVRFATAIESLLAEGSDVFLEIGPHPVLERSILESLPPAGHAAVQAQVLISMRRDQDESDVLLETLATLRRLGAPAPTSSRQTRTELAEAPKLVPISAHSPAALSARARSWLGWLRQVPDEGRPASFMADLGHTTAVRRAHHAHRRGL